MLNFTSFFNVNFPISIISCSIEFKYMIEQANIWYTDPLVH